MERYRKLAKDIEDLYKESSFAFQSFQKESGLLCLSGCGGCCIHPNIEATMLEMLPLALKIIDNGSENDLYEKLNEDHTICLFYQKTNSDGSQGYCKVYHERPSVCRSFGASARKKKDGTKEWLVCKVIKEHHQNILPHHMLESAPVIGTFALKIRGLDHNLSKEIYPINMALKLMLEKLLYLKQR